MEELETLEEEPKPNEEISFDFDAWKKKVEKAISVNQRYITEHNKKIKKLENDFNLFITSK